MYTIRLPYMKILERPITVKYSEKHLGQILSNDLQEIFKISFKLEKI